MKAYITRINGWSLRDRSHYMQHMTAEIAHQLGCREMGIYRYYADPESVESLNSRCAGIIAGINRGDIVICQFPTGNGLKFERALVAHIKAYGGRIVILVHELEALADAGKLSTLGEVIWLYNQAEVLIVPTYSMKKYLLEHGIKNEMKFIVQEMWDYMADDRFSHTPALQKEIFVTDNESSAGINGWNSTVPVKVYAGSVSGGQNIQNMGEMDPDQLFIELSKGGFGLVWYRDEYFLQYMKYSASFSLARYLAAGIPVIVPAGISSRSIIEENHLGLVVNSLEEAEAAVEAMTEWDYSEYVRCVAQFAPALRHGYYTKKCLIDAMQAFYRKDAGRTLIPEESYSLEDCAFTSTKLYKSYGGNLALTWSFRGAADGFLICDSSGATVLRDTKNFYQHYFLLKDCVAENGFAVKAYVETLRGKLIVAESEKTYLQTRQYKNPRVSLIIPAYNAENYIARTIDTVLGQSFSDLEIIVVDDGSTDGTPKIIDWYAEKYSGVKAIHQKNGGTPAARNAGVAQADGEYIGFMDNDDMIHPDMIARLYHAAVESDCDIAVTSVRFIENGTHTISILSHYPMEENTAVDVDRFLDVHASNPYQFPVIWNKLYRAPLIKERPMPEIMFDDEAWLPYIFSFGKKMCYLNEGLYEYDRTIRGNTLVDDWNRKSGDEIFSSHKRAILFYLENGNPEKIEKLKGVARSELLFFTKLLRNPAYEKLWEEVRESYGKVTE